MKTTLFGMVTAICLGLTTTALAIQDEQQLTNTQKLTSPLIPAEQAAEMIRLPKGFQATLFAAEPDVRQPIAITTDAKGRIWVAECITYAESKKNFDTQYNDRIIILEDTDGDGKSDSRKVFWEGAKRLTSIEVGHGGVWLTAAPNFMFIPDADGDDVPDGEPEIVLDGWNDDFVRHNMVNGLKWGPDGWLYGRHGIQATSHVGSPGATDSQRISLNCCMWRFHPFSRDFEVVCEGTTNSWGHDWDKHGELFMINTVIGHLWHVIPGARFRRMYGSHFNPYTYEVIEQTADHFHFSGKESWSEVNRNGISDETSSLGGGHAHCGMMIYQGDNWPDEYQGKLFTANFHGRRLNQESLHREGNGYVGRHEDDFMFTDDLWFRGVEMIYGPDGGVYLLDWSDIGECHENDGVHRTSGRIFKITYGDEIEKPDCDLASKSSRDLFTLLDHENQWFARTARRLLQERTQSDESHRAEIAEMLTPYYETVELRESDEPYDINLLLQIMWTQHVTQSHAGEGANDAIWNRWTRHHNEHIRAAAVKLTIDKPTSSLPVDKMNLLLELANNDDSALVRLHLASAMRRMDDTQKIQMADALCQYGSDANDRTQPNLIWYNLEPAIVNQWRDAIDLAIKTKIPHVQRCIVRRLVAEVTDHPEFVEALLARAVESDDNAAAVLDAIREGLMGRKQIAPPENWDEVNEAFAKHMSTEIEQNLAFIGSVFGQGLSVEQLKSIAVDGNNDTSIRREAIKAYADAMPDGLFETLKGMIHDRSVALQVVRSMAMCSEPQVAIVILNARGAFDVETTRAAIGTLCVRPEWCSTLLNAVKNGQIENSSLTAFHARQIKSHNDEALNQLLKNHWGVVSDSSSEMRATIDRVRELVEMKEQVPDLANGAALFEKHCSSCHVLFGNGGKRGPDLTGSDRKNVEYLLENIVDPSASVADTFRSSVLLIEDGRTLVGVVTEETDETVKLLMVEEELVVQTSEIAGRRDTIKSLMPDGLLDNFSDEEVNDLFGYLRQ